MQVLELMKTHVVKTMLDATLSEASDLMDLYQVTGLPVVDADGRLRGMLTEADVLRALVSVSLTSSVSGNGSGEGASSASLAALCQHAPEVARFPVSDWMSAPALSIDEHCPLDEAAQRLLESGFQRLPVTTENEQVVGTLNRVDVIQALFEALL